MAVATTERSPDGAGVHPPPLYVEPALDNDRVQDAPARSHFCPVDCMGSPLTVQHGVFEFSAPLDVLDTYRFRTKF